MEKIFGDNRNQENVLEFFPQGSIGPWIRCNFSLPYTSTITDSYQYHVKLSTKGYRSLIYR